MLFLTVKVFLLVWTWVIKKFIRYWLISLLFGPIEKSYMYIWFLKIIILLMIVGWLPLATLMVFIFVYNVGYGAMVFITAVELLPTRVKEVGMRLVKNGSSRLRVDLFWLNQISFSFIQIFSKYYNFVGLILTNSHFFVILKSIKKIYN